MKNWDLCNVISDKFHVIKHVISLKISNVHQSEIPKCAGGIYLFFKNHYRPAAKNHYPAILECSSQTRKSMKMSTSSRKKNIVFKEHLQMAASFFSVQDFACHHKYLFEIFVLVFKEFFYRFLHTVERFFSVVISIL